MEIPKECRSCPCFGSNNFGAFCGVTYKTIKYDYKDYQYTKPNWCPLSPIPEFKDLTGCNMSQINYRKGYNDCLKDIMEGK